MDNISILINLINEKIKDLIQKINDNATNIDNSSRVLQLDEELKEKCRKVKNYSIQRFKGLGEMNFTQLWDTTMNPETRTLIQVSIEDAGEADDIVAKLMGDEADERREWIDKNVVFEHEDNFTLEEVEIDGKEDY